MHSLYLTTLAAVLIMAVALALPEYIGHGLTSLSHAEYNLMYYVKKGFRARNSERRCASFGRNVEWTRAYVREMVGTLRLVRSVIVAMQAYRWAAFGGRQ